MRFSPKLSRLASAVVAVAVCATCDAGAVFAPPGVKRVAIAYVGDSTIVVGSEVPMRIVVSVDGAPYPAAQLRLTSSNPAAIRVSDGGDSLFALRRDTATLTARLEGATLPASPPAMSQRLRVVSAGVKLDRVTDTLSSLNDTLRLTAVAFDAQSLPLAGVAPRWTSSDSTVATVNDRGVVTARRNGSARILAVVDFDTAVASVRVAQRLTRVVFSPNLLLLDAIGADSTVVVTGSDAGGSPMTLGDGSAASFVSTNAAVASVSAAGVVTARDNGEAYLRVSKDALIDSIRVEVAQRAVRVLISGAASVPMNAVGEQHLLVARGFDRLGNEIRNNVPAWSSLDTRVAQVDPKSGTVTALDVGTATIVARIDAVTSSVAIQVTNAPATLVLSPESGRLTSYGDTLQLKVVARNALGAVIDGLAVQWRTPDSALVRLTTTGAVVGLGTGTARVIVSASGVADTALVAVSNDVNLVDIGPNRWTLASIGDTLVPPVTVLNARGAVLDRSAALWSAADPSVVHAAGGIIVARDSGSTMVYAVSPTDAGRRDSILVTVTNAPTSIVLSTVRDTFTAVGQSRIYSATVRNARGNLIAGYVISWRSSNSSAVTVSTAGVVTAVGVGEAWVVGRAGTISDSALVDVANLPVSFETLPSAMALTSVGDTAIVRAVARNGIGVAIGTLPEPIVWRTPDAGVLMVLSDGRVIATGVGTGRVIASVSGLADTTVVTVTNVPAVVQITPDAVALTSIGDSVTPAVSILTARGTVLARGSVLWSSDDPSIARVTSTGIITARDTGETYVRATSPVDASRRDSVRVTVTNAPTSIALNYVADTLTAVGRTRTYVADVRNARGNSIVGYPIVWQSSAPSIATVNSLGVATGVGLGSAIVTARAGSVGASVAVLVRNDVTSLDLQPSTLSITTVGDTVRFNPYPRNDLSGDVFGATIGWRSTDTLVATVVGDGRVIATGIGIVRIIATSGALADTSIVTVTNVPARATFAHDADTLRFITDSLAPIIDIRNSRNAVLPRSSMQWSSDDPTVARVSASGMVTARDVGRTMVRATAGTVTDSIAIVVTNNPARLTLDGVLDTLTAPGQTLAYTVDVRNQVNAAIANAPVTWLSSNSAVIAVTQAGAATAIGYGTGLVIAQSGAVADTVTIVVRNPTLLYVDNSVYTAVHVGTASRPFLHIQDAVAVADANDTVLVRRGSSAYAEAVTLGRRITLLGDSTQYLAAGRDPMQLPTIAHDIGDAAITAITTAPIVVRYLAVRHDLEGPALLARGGPVNVSWLYVNPGPQTARVGSGISVEQATGPQVVNVQVAAVNGYGVRLTSVANGRVDSVTVRGVALTSAGDGSGIQVIGGRADQIARSSVRSTDGPQIALDSTDSPIVTNNSVAGDAALLDLYKVTGTPSLVGNYIDLRHQSGDVAAGNSALDGSAGLQIRQSINVAVDQNGFMDQIGGTSLMDAVRLVDARGGSFGARFTRNTWHGSRYAIRSERSTTQIVGNRSDNAAVALVATDADTIAITSDTLGTSTGGCMQLSGAGTALTVASSLLAACSGDGTPAVLATNAASLDVSGSTFTGANQRSIVSNGVRRLSVTSSKLSGVGTLSLTPNSAAGALDLSGDSVIVTNDEISDNHGFAAIRATAALQLRIESNIVARNRVGIRVGARPTLFTMFNNDVYDNDVLGAVSDFTTFTLTTSNWWGDSRGPRSSTNTAAVGDSVVAITLGIGAVAANPVFAGSASSTPLRLVVVRGNGQSVRANSTALQALSLRVVDAQGRPVSGQTVTFTAPVVAGVSSAVFGATKVNPYAAPASNSSGIAEAVVMPRVVGTVTITASAPGAPSIQLTVTGT